MMTRMRRIFLLKRMLKAALLVGYFACVYNSIDILYELIQCVRGWNGF